MGIDLMYKCTVYFSNFQIIGRKCNLLVQNMLLLAKSVLLFYLLNLFNFRKLAVTPVKIRRNYR